MIERDRRYPATDLDVGWQFRSPLGRWETIREVQWSDGVPFAVRIWTDQLPDGYAWRATRSDRFDAVPPRSEQYVREAEVRVLDLAGAARPRMLAVVTFADCEVPDMRWAVTVAERQPQRAGGGWVVTDWPGGAAAPVVVERRDKAGARAVLHAAALVHARALGVPLCDRQGRHQHPGGQVA